MSITNEFCPTCNKCTRHIRQFTLDPYLSSQRGLPTNRVQVKCTQCFLSLIVDIGDEIHWIDKDGKTRNEDGTYAEYIIGKPRIGF